jgi:hypothetical protein
LFAPDPALVALFGVLAGSVSVALPGSFVIQKSNPFQQFLRFGEKTWKMLPELPLSGCDGKNRMPAAKIKLEPLAVRPKPKIRDYKGIPSHPEHLQHMKEMSKGIYDKNTRNVRLSPLQFNRVDISTKRELLARAAESRLLEQKLQQQNKN